MIEPFVSLEAAKLLKQLGYNGQYSYMYTKEGTLLSEPYVDLSEPRVEEDRALHFPAPLWQDALEWIGREYGLFVGAITRVVTSPDVYFCKVMNRSNNVIFGISVRSPMLFSVIGEVTIKMLRQAAVISERREVLGNKVFPNGFQSWKETYFEVVSHIVEANNKGDNVVTDVAASQGTTGLYDLAENTTDLFEEAHLGSNWDEKDFFEEVENFCNKQFKRDEDEKDIL